MYKIEIGINAIRLSVKYLIITRKYQNRLTQPTTGLDEFLYNFLSSFFTSTLYLTSTSSRFFFSFIQYNIK